LADHADAIYVRVQRGDGWRNVAYADLTPDGQADWLERVLAGWDGPVRVVRPRTRSRIRHLISLAGREA
jgi:hypothetical protein